MRFTLVCVRVSIPQSQLGHMYTHLWSTCPRADATSHQHTVLYIRDALYLQRTAGLSSHACSHVRQCTARMIYFSRPHCTNLPLPNHVRSVLLLHRLRRGYAMGYANSAPAHCPYWGCQRSSTACTCHTTRPQTSCTTCELCSMMSTSRPPCSRRTA